MRPITAKPRVLFLCTHNSARSQMAEALLRHEAGDEFDVFSAGTAPARVHPLALQAMGEVGIDMSWQWAKSLDAVAGGEFAYAITVCDRVNESCPTLPDDALRIHWSFEDPTAAFGSAERRLQAFRRVRDEIRQRLRTFITLTCRRIG
ncbi:MAG TPA: arsenate reductase ArsC [Thermoanaerobaculia bacterium]|nr:arsenate reductase ArsC [Thermoanaerobaculia bacterium]